MNGSFCNFYKLALWLALHHSRVSYISSLPRADEPREGQTSCPLLRSCCIGSCHVGVSKRFSRSISLAVYRLSLVTRPLLANSACAVNLLEESATLVFLSLLSAALSDQQDSVLADRQFIGETKRRLKAGFH